MGNKEQQKVWVITRNADEMPLAFASEEEMKKHMGENYNTFYRWKISILGSKERPACTCGTDWDNPCPMHKVEQELQKRAFKADQRAGREAEKYHSCRRELEMVQQIVRSQQKTIDEQESIIWARVEKLQDLQELIDRKDRTISNLRKRLADDRAAYLPEEHAWDSSQPKSTAKTAVQLSSIALLDEIKRHILLAERDDTNLRKQAELYENRESKARAKYEGLHAELQETRRERDRALDKVASFTVNNVTGVAKHHCPLPSCKGSDLGAAECCGNDYLECDVCGLHIRTDAWYEIHQLRDKVAELEQELLDSCTKATTVPVETGLRSDELEGSCAPGPHAFDPTDCPTFYDFCRCTVENLEHNIERAEEADRENDILRERVEQLEKELNEMSNLHYGRPAGPASLSDIGFITHVVSQPVVAKSRGEDKEEYVKESRQFLEVLRQMRECSSEEKILTTVRSRLLKWADELEIQNNHEIAELITQLNAARTTIGNKDALIMTLNNRMEPGADLGPVTVWSTSPSVPHLYTSREILIEDNGPLSTQYCYQHEVFGPRCKKETK